MNGPEINGMVIAVVVGLTEMAKQLGVEGKQNLVVAFVLGAALGAGHHLSVADVPADIAAWYMLIIAALIHGLAPSGLYKFSKKFMPLE